MRFLSRRAPTRARSAPRAARRRRRRHRAALGSRGSAAGWRAAAAARRAAAVDAPRGCRGERSPRQRDAGFAVENVAVEGRERASRAGDPRGARRRARHADPRRRSRRGEDAARGAALGAHAPRSSGGCPTRSSSASTERQPLALLAAPRQARADRPRRHGRCRPTSSTASARSSCWSATTRRKHGAALLDMLASEPALAAARRRRGAGRRPALEPAARQRHRRGAARGGCRGRLASARRARAQRRAARARHPGGRSAPARPARAAPAAEPPKPPPPRRAKPAGSRHEASARRARAAASSPPSISAPPRSCCFIARLDGDEPRIVGIGHQVSRGVRNGVIVDIEAASHSILTAVHAAEQMAGEQIAEVGGQHLRRLRRLAPRQGRDRASTAARSATRDMRRVLEQGYRLKEPADRTVIHSVPVGFSIDGSRGIRDPRGMFGQKLAVNMNIVTADVAALRNLADLHRPLPSRDRGAGRQPLCRRASPRWSRTRANSASPSSTWAAAPPPSPCSSTAISSSPTACRSAAATSPTTSPAASRRRSPMPSA